MKKQYTVGVREVHFRYFEVVAENPDAAKVLVHQRAAGAVDLEIIEFSHELSMETWSVEARPTPQTDRKPGQ